MHYATFCRRGQANPFKFYCGIKYLRKYWPGHFSTYLLNYTALLTSLAGMEVK